MLKYWSNVFAMIGVASIATAIFHTEPLYGFAIGFFFTLLGAWLYGLSIPVTPSKKGKQ